MKVREFEKKKMKVSVKSGNLRKIYESQGKVREFEKKDESQGKVREFEKKR